MAIATPSNRPSNAVGNPAEAGSARAWLLLPGALLAVQTSALILFGRDAGSWAWDQTQYHVIAINQFAAEWPRPDLVNYPSATSPGWHLLLAMLVNLGASAHALRWAAAIAGTLLMLVATHTAGRWVSPRTAACLMLPLAFSPYAVGGSAWITTDVPALACIALSLAATTAGVAIVGERQDGSGSRARVRRWPWTAGVWATAGVAIRQPVAWLAAPIAWRALRERRWSALAAAALPAALLAALVAKWHGLMPPAYRTLHDHGANPAGLILMLALAGVWGFPLAAALLWTDRDARRRTLIAALAAAGAAAAFSVAVPTDFSKDAGRCYGPLWQIVERLPAPGGHSPLLLVLAPLGAATIAVLARLAIRRGAGQISSLLLVAFACAAAANAANSQAWERYADLPLLLLVPWLAALGVRSGRSAAWLSVAALLVAIVQLAFASVTVWKPAFLAAATATSGGGA